MAPFAMVSCGAPPLGGGHVCTGKDLPGACALGSTPHIRAHLEWLQTELKELNRELHDRLQAQAELLRSVPGMGSVVAELPWGVSTSARSLPWLAYPP